MQGQKDTINDQLCKWLSEKMVLDIVTRLVNDANTRQLIQITVRVVDGTPGPM
jgi:hypothetical protein